MFISQLIDDLLPQLCENDASLIGIGLEEMGAEDFVLGGFFKGGDLYIDAEVGMIYLFFISKIIYFTPIFNFERAIFIVLVPRKSRR